VASFLPSGPVIVGQARVYVFSSLSESGFIPTNMVKKLQASGFDTVLISFREWLHSYTNTEDNDEQTVDMFSSLSESGFIPT